jgi:hypothetical protein
MFVLRKKNCDFNILCEKNEIMTSLLLINGTVCIIRITFKIASTVTGSADTVYCS